MILCVQKPHESYVLQPFQCITVNLSHTTSAELSYTVSRKSTYIQSPQKSRCLSTISLVETAILFAFQQVQQQLETQKACISSEVNGGLDNTDIAMCMDGMQTIHNRIHIKYDFFVPATIIFQ